MPSQYRIVQDTLPHNLVMLLSKIFTAVVQTSPLDKGKAPPQPNGTGPKHESKKPRPSKKEATAAKENVQPGNAAGTSAAAKPQRKSGSGRTIATPHKLKKEGV